MRSKYEVGLAQWEMPEWQMWVHAVANLALLVMVFIGDVPWTWYAIGVVPNTLWGLMHFQMPSGWRWYFLAGCLWPMWTVSELLFLLKCSIHIGWRAGNVDWVCQDCGKDCRSEFGANMHEKQGCPVEVLRTENAEMAKLIDEGGRSWRKDRAALARVEAVVSGDSVLAFSSYGSGGASVLADAVRKAMEEKP